jgi:general stress protein 26
MPTGTVDLDFSDPSSQPTPWQEAVALLQRAEVFWLTTVRKGCRPHQTPLFGVWQDGAIYFCTGPREQKAKNIEHNRHVLVTNGSNTQQGLDVVIEGEALRVTDEALLRSLADAWVAKYGDEWRFEVRDGAFHQEGEAWVFEVTPRKAIGFHKTPFSQTTWRFDSEP